MGDRIRIVRIPSLFSASHYHNGEWEDTFALYRLLIANKEVLEIREVDEYGPWIDYVTFDEDGTKVYHSLYVKDDSWERVE